MHLNKVERDIKFEKSLGARVRELRLELGWSQKVLADYSDLEQNQIQRVENAKNTTTVAIITAIAKALGKQPVELFKTEYVVKVNTNLESPTTPRKVTTQFIRQVLDTSFLNSSRSVIDIVKYCEDKFEVTLPSSATSAVLKKLVDQKLLKRIPSKIKGRFVYQKN